MNSSGWLHLDGWSEALPLAVLVLGTTALYVLWFYFSAQRAREARMRREGEPLDVASRMRAFLRAKYSGALILGGGSLGLAFALGLSPREVGLGAPATAAGWLAAIAAAMVLVPVASYGASQPANRGAYPECAQPRFTSPTARASALAWAAYLLGYEVLFRGVLLGGLASWIGPAPAVVVMTALYVLAHLNKPAPETLSCLVMGPLFAALAFASDSIWLPWLVHVAIAVVSENAAARANPDIESWWSSTSSDTPR